MGWRFRHSFKVIPGVRLNPSKSGLNASIGSAPFTVNVGPRGVYGTASLPGSGISYRQQIGNRSETPHELPSHPVAPRSLPLSIPALIRLPSPIRASVGARHPGSKLRLDQP
jgi:hypothetical protein